MEDTQLPIQENNQKLTDWKNEPTIMTLKADLESAKPEVMMLKCLKFNIGQIY
ncbi:MAG: hypothetical protein ACLU5J_12875 [Christensenellales bacterium]